MFGFELVWILVAPAVALYLMYWVIRIAVRHAIEDAAARRVKKSAALR